MRIGVISDTHVPDRADQLPEEIGEIFRGVDLILHAGDLCQARVLDWLRAMAPVVAVRGNRDDRLTDLPEKAIVLAENWRIGLIHGTRLRSQEASDRLRYLLGDRSFREQQRFVRQAFADEAVHCIVFGHSHQVCHEMEEGILLFNPGGVVPSWRGGPSSVGLLEATGHGLVAQIIELRHPPQPLPLRERLRRSLSTP